MRIFRNYLVIPALFLFPIGLVVLLANLHISHSHGWSPLCAWGPLVLLSYLRVKLQANGPGCLVCCSPAVVVSLYPMRPLP